METSAKHVDRESEAFKKLKGKMKHFCPDWDFMAIDETCEEFQACNCKFEGQHAVTGDFDRPAPKSSGCVHDMQRGQHWDECTKCGARWNPELGWGVPMARSRRR